MITFGFLFQHNPTMAQLVVRAQLYEEIEEAVTVRVLTTAGVRIKNSINCGGKRECAQHQHDDMFIYDGSSRVFLAPANSFSKGHLTKKEFNAWADTQTPWFLVNLDPTAQGVTLQYVGH